MSVMHPATQMPEEVRRPDQTDSQNHSNEKNNEKLQEAYFSKINEEEETIKAIDIIDKIKSNLK
jgi:spore coat protein CotF